MKNLKLNILFDGDDIPRDSFLASFRDKILDFLGQDEGVNFYMFFKEAIKNIYDHAEGKGECNLEKIDEKTISFEIKDYGTESYDFSFLKERGTEKKTAYNFGVGLRHVEEMGLKLGLDFNVDTSKGFKYTGKYPLNTF